MNAAGLRLGFVIASQRQLEILRSLAGPGDQARAMVRGYAAGVMPDTYGDSLSEDELALFRSDPGSTVLFVADEPRVVSKVLGALRLHVARKENLLDPQKYEFLWVVDFPMFEWSADEGRYEFMHHPFTSPLESDASQLETDPGAVRARAYDLVLNGSEIAGGSIKTVALNAAFLAADAGTRHDPAELIDPRGRRVVLVVSDLLGRAWRDGRMGRFGPSGGFPGGPGGFPQGPGGPTGPGQMDPGAPAPQPSQAQPGAVDSKLVGM